MRLGTCTRLRLDTRMNYAQKAKLISMYELAYCQPIAVMLLLVLIAFYCIHRKRQWLFS